MSAARENVDVILTVDTDGSVVAVCVAGWQLAPVLKHPISVFSLPRMTGEDASPAAPARTRATVSREMVVAAAAKLANTCRRVIEHQWLMGSSAYLKSASHPSSRLHVPGPYAFRKFCGRSGPPLRGGLKLTRHREAESQGWPRAVAIIHGDYSHGTLSSHSIKAIFAAGRQLTSPVARCHLDGRGENPCQKFRPTMGW
jgi:hypothetical protein